MFFSNNFESVDPVPVAIPSPLDLAIVPMGGKIPSSFALASFSKGAPSETAQPPFDARAFRYFTRVEFVLIPTQGMPLNCWYSVLMDFLTPNKGTRSEENRTE